MAERFPCPCCGDVNLHEVGGYDICRVCGWEDDPVQSHDPAYPGGANVMSLDAARAEFLATGVIDFHPGRPISRP